MKLIKNNKFILVLVVLLAILFRFYDVSNIDIRNDAALNSFRALNWFDFLGFEGQSSPITWFNYIPWWGNLSFHDMPPLSMALEYLSLHIFGANNFGVLMPFIFSGLALTILLYFFVAKLRSKNEALLASFIFAVSSYSVWVSRTAYLEAILAVFIILSFFYFLYFINYNKYRYLYISVIFLGLSLLTKYTALFLIPAMAAYLLIWKRDVLKNKHLYLSALMLVVILSPIIIYNYFVWKTRGHFDAALSSMLGMHPEDFSIIAQRGTNSNILKNLGSSIVVLYRSSSLPIFAIYYFSLIDLLIRVVKRRASNLEYFLGLNLFFILLMFSFSGAPARLLFIIVPFLVISGTIFIFRLLNLFGTKNKKVFYIILVLFFSFEVFYSINTNLLIKPIGRADLLYSPYRFYNIGFNELERYLNNEIIKGEFINKRPETVEQMRNIILSKNYVVLFDERMDWFSGFWYVYPHIIYYKEPVFLFGNLETAMNQTGDQNFVNYFDNLGINEYWFVYVTDKGVKANKSENYASQMEAIKNDLEKAGIYAVKEIKDFKGDVVFKIYHFYHNK